MAVFASADVDQPLQKATNFTKHTAGAELNVAVGLSRLDLEIDYVSQVGADQFGDFLIEEAQIAGVGVGHFYKTPDFPTGIYFKERVSTGDPNVLYYRKGSAAANFDINLLDKIKFNEYSFAHLSGIFPALGTNCVSVFQKLVDELIAADVTITFDPNLRPTLWESEEQMRETLNHFAKYARVILPGINEGRVLLGTEDPEEIADRYFEQSEITELVIVKLGAEGAFYKTRSGESDIIKGFKIDNVVDTVGAGDGFSVGFVSALMDGLDIPEAVQRACYIGARAITVAGDSDGYPTREQLDSFTM